MELSFPDPPAVCGNFVDQGILGGIYTLQLKVYCVNPLNFTCGSPKAVRIASPSYIPSIRCVVAPSVNRHVDKSNLDSLDWAHALKQDPESESQTN